MRLLTLSTGLLVATLSSAGAESSVLWGERGERWSPGGRLPDFSYAGYHRGEQPIPDVPPAANVRDFGAVGDGVADDTSAIQNAINQTARGAVFVPAGRCASKPGRRGSRKCAAFARR